LPFRRGRDLAEEFERLAQLAHPASAEMSCPLSIDPGFLLPRDLDPSNQLDRLGDSHFQKPTAYGTRRRLGAA